MGDSSSKIVVEHDGPVTTIIINRPEVKNALDIESARLLTDAIKAFEADPDARVGVLWGTGGAFCSGADLKELAVNPNYEPWAGSEDGPLHSKCKKPIIAAVAGHACAGGLGVALWCDLRVVEESGSFAVLSRRWGVPMTEGTTVRLPRLIGMSNALDMLMTARIVSAREAETMGLANRVVLDGTSREEAEKLALQIAEFPQIAMLSDRASADEQNGMLETEAIANELRLASDARAKEAQSGAKRFASGEGRHGNTNTNNRGSTDS